MKCGVINIILVVLFVIPSVGFGQKIKTVYLTESLEETTKELASYYREIQKISKKWTVKDCYLNGNVLMEGEFKTRRLKKRHGKFTYYYKNGQVNSKTSYRKGVIYGVSSEWHQNGKLNLVGNYNKYGQKINTWIRYRESGKIVSKGDYVKGNKEGEWEWYFENGQVSALETYNNDRQNNEVYWNELGVLLPDQSKGESLPEFEGGMSAFVQYLEERIVYPEDAIKDNVTGKVFVKFVVSKKGEVEKVNIVNSVSPTLDEEAVRVLQSCPKWNPARQHNLPVDVWYTVPIEFSLK